MNSVLLAMLPMMSVESISDYGKRIEFSAIGNDDDAGYVWIFLFLIQHGTKWGRY